MAATWCGPSLDHVIRPLQERRRDREAERLGGLEVDDQLELTGLLDGEVARLRALQDLVHVSDCPRVHAGQVRAIRDKPARPNESRRMH